MAEVQRGDGSRNPDGGGLRMPPTCANCRRDCPTKLLLANPSLRPQSIHRALSVEQMEMKLLTGLIARQRILLNDRDLTKVLAPDGGPKTGYLRHFR